MRRKWRLKATAFGMRHGSYRMIEQEFEFEGVPTRSFAYELSAHVTNHSINGVEGLDNTDRTQFSGFSTDLRYLIIGRGPNGHANSLLRDAVG